MERRMGLVGTVLVALVLTGCASTPVERQEATAESLTELRQAMTETRAQIEKTLASLINLTNAPAENLRPAYQEFAKNTDTMTEQARRIEAESNQVQRRSDRWLSSWEKSQVQNPELKQLSAERREQVVQRFQSIEGSLVAAREAFGPFVRNLQDVKKVVGNDLTPRGVQAVSGTTVVQNATERGQAAARALDVTIDDLRALTQTMTPVAAR
jgi:uncharacterized membrane-anchored protein YhcB (DUF1043 family)